MATPANSIVSLSRLRIWMTPMSEERKQQLCAYQNRRQHADSIGEFQVWSDDENNNKMPGRLVSLGGDDDDNNNDFPPSINEEERPQKEQQNEKDGTGDGNKKMPIIQLREKRRFCCMIDSTECRRCASMRRGRPTASLDWNSSRGSSTTSTSVSSDVTNSSSSSNSYCPDPSPPIDSMHMRIGHWLSLPRQTCGFCYIQYKRHCQKLSIPYPRPEDPGFWSGHITKDQNGDILCPQLRKLMCPLCFSTGKKAHTLKFCPLKMNK